ncbi:MAG: glutathione S-transferase family protein [Pararhodobacter sp.]
MYRLHYAPDNASLIVRLALEELGQPYETALVDRATRAQDSAAFRALNPVGVIPVLETPVGPLSETGAILLWLSETHGSLAPLPCAPDRGVFLKWLFFVSNTVHSDLRLVFYPEKYVSGDAAAQERLHDAVTARLLRHVALLEDLAGAGHPWFGAEAPSVLDLYVLVLLRWARLYGPCGTGWLNLAAFARLGAMAARFEGRASVRAAARAEGLGAAPLSRPTPCCPPEGSALG